MRKSFLIILCLISFTACSLLKPPASNRVKLINEPIVIDIFAARGFLGGSEYERYHLHETTLWKECGNVSSAEAKKKNIKMEGDRVFNQDPQLELQERRVDRVSEDQLITIQEKILNLIAARKENNDSVLPAPGSVFSLGEPGLLELNIAVGNNKKHFITSVDAVAEAENESLRETYQLFASLRGIGKEICGAKTFFGIEKINN